MEFLVEFGWNKTKHFCISIPQESFHQLSIQKPFHQNTTTSQKQPSNYSPDSEFDSFVQLQLVSASPLNGSSTSKRILVNALLGILNAFGEDFLAVVTSCEAVGLVSGCTVYRITGVAFYSLQDDRYDKFWNASSEGQTYRVPGTFPSKGSNSGSTDNATFSSPTFSTKQFSQNESLLMHPCYEIAKLLASGTFYFSYHTNLSQLFSPSSSSSTSSTSVKEMDEFVWNLHMLECFNEFFKNDASPIEIAFVSVIQGFFDCCQLPTKLHGMESGSKGGLGEEMRAHSQDSKGSQGKSPQGKLGIISKVSWKRAGTRLQLRGCDDEGNVSNFVYTTLFFELPSGGLFTFDIVRGSVPLFWEQIGLQLGQHKIQMLRSFESSHEAFKRHFELILKRHEYIFIIDLLSQSKSTSEYELSNAYRKHLLQLNNENIGYTCFDFNSICKNDFTQIYALMKKIVPIVQRISYNFKQTGQTDLSEQSQHGIFRVNCMDCLDRTNIVQCSIAKEVFFNFCKAWHSHFSIPLTHNQIASVINSLWADNGDAISKINTGTAALKSGLTRTGRRTLMEYVDDMAKAAQRIYINAFQDKDRQQIIDLLLGRYPEQQRVLLHDPLVEQIQQELTDQRSVFEEWIEKSIFCISWNVGGLAGNRVGVNLDISDLFQTATAGKGKVPDIVVICLQEIVPLSASSLIQLGNGMQVESKREWELLLSTQLANFFPGESFQLLFSSQLVGITLMVWVKASLGSFIRGLEGCIKKTGLKGITGNKGAVVCRFDLHNSSFCFVGCHFAAGQDEVEERNMCWQLIMQDSLLSRGRRIANHQSIIWLGDLNYRVNLDFYRAASLASRGQFSMLWRYDQLTEEMNCGRVFLGFKEGILSFYPTYRYELNQDRYANDEKQRIPSWTDRILYAGPLQQQSYNSVQTIKVSDHRPVVSLFNASVKIVDVRKREQLEQDLIDRRRNEVTENQKEQKERKDNLISFDDDDDKILSFESALNRFTLKE